MKALGERITEERTVISGFTSHREIGKRSDPFNSFMDFSLGFHSFLRITALAIDTHRFWDWQEV